MRVLQQPVHGCCCEGLGLGSSVHAGCRFSRNWDGPFLIRCVREAVDAFGRAGTL